MRKRHTVTALLFLLCGFTLTGPDRVPAAADPAAIGGFDNVVPADFTLPTLDGSPVTLDRFLGKKPVLLVFWATWCPECKAAIPEINALSGGPLSERVQILGLNFRETRKKVSAVVKSRGIRYTVLLDEHGSVARAYGVVGIPTYVLISREGKVVYRKHTLPADLSRYL